MLHHGINFAGGARALCHAMASVSCTRAPGDCLEQFVQVRLRADGPPVHSLFHCVHDSVILHDSYRSYLLSYHT